MQGYLKKKSPKALGKGKVVDVWQRRYFVLTGDQLKYYKDKHGADTSTSSSRQPLKTIAMADVRQAAPNPKHLDMLTVDLGAERKVKLQAAEEEDRDAWVAAIEQSMVAAWARQGSASEQATPRCSHAVEAAAPCSRGAAMLCPAASCSRRCSHVPRPHVAEVGTLSSSGGARAGTGGGGHFADC